MMDDKQLANERLRKLLIKCGQQAEYIRELEQKIDAIKSLPSYYLECPTGEFDQMVSATDIMDSLSPVLKNDDE